MLRRIDRGEGLAPGRLASRNGLAITDVSRLDSLAVSSTQYHQLIAALKKKRIRTIEDGRLVDPGEYAFVRKANDGVIELVIDPTRTRYPDVLHEARPCKNHA